MEKSYPELKLVPLLCLLCFLLSSGCASMITQGMPAEKRVLQGETFLEQTKEYEYSLENLGKERFYLMKAPLCQERVRLVQISKKQTRGMLLAMAEIPFFGLGLADWVAADALAKSSKKERPAGSKPTGRLIKCGDWRVAARQRLLLQIPELNELTRLDCNEEGVFSLTEYVKRDLSYHYLNLFVQENGDFKYLDTLYLHWN